MKAEWPVSRKAIKAAAEREPGIVIGVEAVAGFKACAQDLRADLMGNHAN
jgi:hypothetical protein